MRVRDVCSDDPVVGRGDESLFDAARRMREEHVGDLIVVDEGVPVGVVTDRDIVVAVLAKGVDLTGLTLADVMTNDPVTVEESASLAEAVERMRVAGVRRLPVVDREDLLVGVLAMDDVLKVLSELLGGLVETAMAQQVREVVERR